MARARKPGRTRKVPAPVETPGERARDRLLLPLLALLPLATFGPRLGREFLVYDDDVYITLNDRVRQGLTWPGARWALTTGHAANWHPVTWLSHMADVSLFGMNPVAHHAVNLLWHVVNTLLLFLVLRSLTQASWRSAWVAALFALHPAHVESVAWAAERKDLLSTAFGLAAMWVYGHWVRDRRRAHYVALLLLFGAALMSKPMLVSLPAVLLLLDFWPLARCKPEKKPGTFFGVGGPGSARLIVEKAPLFLMAAASSVVTLLVQKAGGAVRSFESFPLSVRIGNAFVAYAGYLKMLVWPADLAIFYPHPGTALVAWKVFGSALLLAGLSAGALALRQRAPFLIVGWLWFLVTLLPVIGVVQVGFQAMADRYTYFPFVGLFIAIAWGFSAITTGSRYGRMALRMGAIAVLAAASLAAAAQARFWKNNETLFLHAIAVTKANSLADNNLGHYYNETGRPAKALPRLSEAVRLAPEKFEIHNNLGVSLFLLGRFEEAQAEFSQSLRLEPRYATAVNNLARTRFVQGEISEAIHGYEAAIALAPESAELRRRLAIAWLIEGETASALLQLERESRISPTDVECRRLLADVAAFGKNPKDPSLDGFRRFLAAAHLETSVALYGRGKKDEAAAHLRKALELVPDFAPGHNELGTRLVQEGRLDEAAAEFRRALAIDPGFALAHNNLGYVLFLTGRREAAVEQYREALRLQPGFPLAQNNLELARGQIEGRSGNGISSVTPGPR